MRREQYPSIGQRSDGQERHLARMGTDGVRQEVHCLIHWKRGLMRPARQRGGLLGDWLALLSLHGTISAWVDGNLPAGRLAQNTRQRGALDGLASDCGDTQQFAVRVRE